MGKLINIGLSLLVSAVLLSARAEDVKQPEVQPETLHTKFTQEQVTLLTMAYRTGAPYNLGRTLQAIIWKESFVGGRVVRISPSNWLHRSYGVGHVIASTAVEVTGEAEPAVVKRLLSDDIFAIETALKVLENMRARVKGWRRLVIAYNAGTNNIDKPSAIAYSDDIASKVRWLEENYNVPD